MVLPGSPANNKSSCGLLPKLTFFIILVQIGLQSGIFEQFLNLWGKPYSDEQLVGKGSSSNERETSLIKPQASPTENGQAAVKFEISHFADIIPTSEEENDDSDDDDDEDDDDSDDDDDDEE